MAVNYYSKALKMSNYRRPSCYALQSNEKAVGFLPNGFVQTIMFKAGKRLSIRARCRMYAKQADENAACLDL